MQVQLMIHSTEPPAAKRRKKVPSPPAPALTMAPISGPAAEKSVLYVKMGPNGTMGDCPFCQKVNLALRSKGVNFRTALVDVANKPDWFLQNINPKGNTPAFVTAAGRVLSNSEDIVAFADQSVPQNQLGGKDGSSKVKALIRPLWPALKQLLKNKDARNDRCLKMIICRAISDLNLYLAAAPGPFLLGDHLSAEDCEAAAPLHHCAVALPHFKNMDPLSDKPALKAYLSALQALPFWAEAICPPATIIDAWERKGVVVEATATKPEVQAMAKRGHERAARSV